MDKARYLQAIRQGCVDPWAASVYWKSSPSPAPAPDYKGAAESTASGNLEAAKQAQQANMVNQNTPYGSLQYTQDAVSRFGYNPSYSSNITLSPTGQALLSQAIQASIPELQAMQAQAQTKGGSNGASAVR